MDLRMPAIAQCRKRKWYARAFDVTQYKLSKTIHHEHEYINEFNIFTHALVDEEKPWWFHNYMQSP